MTDATHARIAECADRVDALAKRMDAVEKKRKDADVAGRSFVVSYEVSTLDGPWQKRSYTFELEKRAKELFDQAKRGTQTEKFRSIEMKKA